MTIARFKIISFSILLLAILGNCSENLKNADPVLEESDSDRIEKAIAEALKQGIDSIQIPRYDSVKHKEIWLIDRAIVLPSDFTLILNDCLIRLSPGTRDNIITNSGARSPELGENKNIKIIGRGRAVLSGGLENHFDPDLPGDMSGNPTIGILLYNTKYFVIEGIEMEETQAWAISCENGCAYGEISNIKFNNSAKYYNQDGIDIRKGCHDITISNITGITGDDVIALTGLRTDLKSQNTRSTGMQIGGTWKRENDDIYNISISDINATSIGNCFTIRLLSQDGVKMYNIHINNVTDYEAADTIKGGIATQAETNRRTICIGDVRYWSIRLNQPGETFGIFINNVVSHAPTVIQIRGSLRDSRLTGIGGSGDSNRIVEIWDKGLVENVGIETFSF